MAKGFKIAKITENDSQEQRISKLNSNFQNLLATAMKLDKLGVLSNRNKKQADEAAADAAAAQEAADNAQQSANDAQTAADVAKNTADAAQASANEAATAASNAQTSADNAAKEAHEANEKAQTAADSAAKANTDLAGVKEEVTGIKADAATLRSDLESQIETVTTTMETDYAKKTDLSSTEATLRTEISTSAAGIEQTVSENYAKKTDVEGAITTAKADLQTQITQNAEQISLTAKSVEQAQVEIKANATNITEAKNAAATAQSTANAAKTDAQEAATAAANAQSAADAANTAASKAQSKANEAATAASTAQSAADKAKEDLATAQAKLAEVESNANATAEDLETAKAAVTAAQNAADAAQSAADTAKANAATAQSTADTAKANAATAQSTANTAKTNAANAQKAAEDAQASADAANGALAVLEPRVTAAETAIEQNSEAITLKANATDVYSKADADQKTADAINSLAIGGRNLAIASKDLSKRNSANRTKRYASVHNSDSIRVRDDGFTEIVASSGVAYRGPSVFLNSMGFDVGDSFTYSVSIDSIGVHCEIDVFLMEFDSSGRRVYSAPMLHDGSSTPAHTWYLRTINSDSTIRVSTTLIWSQEAQDLIDSGGYIRMTIQNRSFTAEDGAYVSFYAQKLEKGNKATDWTPAPEDIDAAILKEHNAMLQVASDSITSAVSQSKTYTDTTLGSYSTTEQMNSAITQKANEITTSVSSTYQVKGDYATKTQAQGYANTAKTEAVSAAEADATTKADAAKTAAINASAADATSKANAAEAAAKADTAEKLKSYSTTVQMNSAIEQKADSITQTVSETYQPKGDYVTGTSAYSQLTQTVNGLNSTVQSHSGSISNLQHTADGIKVRLENQQTVSNLVNKSRRLDGWGYVVSSGVTLSKNVSTSAPEFGEVTVAQFNASTSNASAQSSYIHMINAARVTSGKKYTFSMWARKVSGGNARPLFSLSSSNQSFVLEENLTTEWKRYSRTFTFVPSLASNKWSDITVSFGVSVLANQTGVFEICCPQLEAGDTMNPWSASSVDATDYMSFTEEGLVIGDMTEDGLGNNVLIDSDSVDLRTGSYICGSFSLNDGYAAHASAVECIAMTSGSSLKWPNMCPWKVTLDKSGLNPGDVIKIAGTWTQSINGQIRYSLTLDHYAVIGEALSGNNICIGAIGDFATDGFVYLSSAGNGNYYPLIPGDVSDSRMETDEVKAMGNKSLSLSSGDRTSSIVLGNGFDISSSDALNALVSNFRIDASGDKSEVISPDVVELTHSTSGNSIGVGVGSGGVNRGIYDYVFDKWAIYCNETDLYIASSRGGAFKPYYTAGDTISLDRLNTAGFVTSSKTKVYFSFNLGKPLYGVSSISCSSIDGLSLRQNNAYTHGSSSSSLVKPSSYLASTVGNSIGICATFTNTTNAINNAPIGVAASIKITFA